jgi:CheY-like chemotaxis protein
VEVRYHFGENLPPIEADPAQVRQVIMNLITNAAESIGTTAGIVTVQTAATEVATEELEHDFLETKNQQYVVLSVSDTGVGMDGDTQAKIFDPFFTTKFAGRGLGLAAVLGIVRNHRGAIEIESEPGQGTVFRILFPRSPPLPEQSMPPTPATSASWQGQGLVLVVDDDEGARLVAAEVLKRLGFEVLTATDGREGVATFQSRADEIRAVILDLTMPVMGGIEAIRRIREIRPDTPVLLSSGYSQEDATSRLEGERAEAFLEKPYLPSQLRAKLRRILDRAGD